MAKRNVGYTIVGLLALLAVPALRAYQQLDNWSQRFGQLDELESSVVELRDRAPVSGIETISWEPGESVSLAAIELPADFRYVPDRVFTVAEVDGSTAAAADGLTLSTRVARVGGTTTLTIRASRLQTTSEELDSDGPQTVDVRWLVVP